MVEEEISILDYWNILIKWRWVTCIVFFVGVSISLIYSFTTQKLYEAVATALPPEALQERGALVTSQLPYIFRQELPSGLYVSGPGTQVIIALLKSQRMMKSIVDSFKLDKFYNINKKTAVRIIKRIINISTSKEGAISVKVTTPDPTLSADIANFCIKNLDNLNQELQITSAKPIIHLLDRAEPPDTPSKPNIKLNLLISGIFSIFVGIFLSFILNYIQQTRRNYHPRSN